MKKNLLSFTLGFALVSAALAGGSAPAAMKTVPWINCCVDASNSVRCNNTTTLNNCYYACQVGCGDRGTATGDKCRETCDNNY